MAGIENLPDEVLLHIIRLLETDLILNVISVLNRRFRDLCHETKSLWKSFSAPTYWIGDNVLLLLEHRFISDALRILDVSSIHFYRYASTEAISEGQDEDFLFFLSDSIYLPELRTLHLGYLYHPQNCCKLPKYLPNLEQLDILHYHGPNDVLDDSLTWLEKHRERLTVTKKGMYFSSRLRSCPTSRVVSRPLVLFIDSRQQLKQSLEESTKLSRCFSSLVVDVNRHVGQEPELSMFLSKYGGIVSGVTVRSLKQESILQLFPAACPNMKSLAVENVILDQDFHSTPVTVPPLASLTSLTMELNFSPFDLQRILLASPVLKNLIIRSWNTSAAAYSDVSNVAFDLPKSLRSLLCYSRNELSIPLFRATERCSCLDSLEGYSDDMCAAMSKCDHLHLWNSVTDLTVNGNTSHSHHSVCVVLEHMKRQKSRVRKLAISVSGKPFKRVLRRAFESIVSFSDLESLCMSHPVQSEDSLGDLRTLAANLPLLKELRVDHAWIQLPCAQDGWAQLFSTLSLFIMLRCLHVIVDKQSDLPADLYLPECVEASLERQHLTWLSGSRVSSWGEGAGLKMEARYCPLAYRTVR